MNKYKFLSNKENSKEEFIKKFNQHLKKRKINLEEFKKDSISISNYLEEIIYSQNINGLIVFEELGIKAHHTNISLYNCIQKINDFNNWKDFLFSLSKMDFFKEKNINENENCILSYFIGKKDYFIDYMFYLGYPKKLVGNRNYLSYLLRDNCFNKINNLVKNNYHYSLDSFLNTERGPCNSLKKLQDKIKCTYLILDNSVDDKEKIQKYALNFLYVILKSKFSTEETIKEYIDKYKLKVPSLMFKNYYSYFEDIDKNSLDKFNLIYRNLDIAEKDKEIESSMIEILKKIYKERNIDSIEYLINKNNNFSPYILTLFDKMIPSFLEEGKIKEMNFIKKYFPELLKSQEYDLIASGALNKFLAKHILLHTHVSHYYFKTHTDFIIDFFSTKSCLNKTINSLYHKESTLFTLACKDNNKKILEFLSKQPNFDIGKNMVLFLKKEKDSFGLTRALEQIKKLKLDSKLCILDSNFYKQHFGMFKQDTENSILLVNSTIEKKLLSLNISNINNKTNNTNTKNKRL